MQLIERLKSGDRRAAARLISILENRDTDFIEYYKEIFKMSGKAHIIGVTGPPGAGKSTLTDKLAKQFRNRDLKVGIIAVDPTSPFTGGAILGDRVRMGDLATDPGVFIRSMGSRGHLGGLSEATKFAVRVLDAYGCDVIFIETVGVGQSEIEIVRHADTVLMVMVPGLGDDIQAIKAGIMEIGDVFAVNKSDREGAKRTKTEIEMMLDSSSRERKPTVTLTTASEGTGVNELMAEIDSHRNYLEENNLMEVKRKQQIDAEIDEMIIGRIFEKIKGDMDISSYLRQVSEQVSRKELDPYTASSDILAKIGGFDK